MAEQKVRVYDLRTRRLTTIPARELAPGMVRARRVEGVAGDVWVDASQVRQEPVRQPPFEEDFRQTLRHIRDALCDVVPQTVEDWEDTFRRDTHPDEEIGFWQTVAEAYTHFAAGRPLSPEHKLDLLEVVFACLNNGTEYVLLTTSPATLSREGVKEIAEYVDRMAGQDEG
jgi:hypothetical protein